MAEQCSIAWPCPALSVHLSMDIGCSHFLDIRSNATMNISLTFFYKVCEQIFSSLGSMSRSEIMGYGVVPGLTF